MRAHFTSLQLQFWASVSYAPGGHGKIYKGQSSLLTLKGAKSQANPPRYKYALGKLLHELCLSGGTARWIPARRHTALRFCTAVAPALANLAWNLLTWGRVFDNGNIDLILESSLKTWIKASIHPKVSVWLHSGLFHEWGVEVKPSCSPRALHVLRLFRKQIHWDEVQHLLPSHRKAATGISLRLSWKLFLSFPQNLPDEAKL